MHKDGERARKGDQRHVKGQSKRVHRHNEVPATRPEKPDAADSMNA
jgi:hypothetical protein